MQYEDPNTKPQVKKYVMDETKNWEVRYQELETHHIIETTWLLEEIKRLKSLINAQVDLEVDQSSRKGYPWD